jgi:hypothetical protein
MQVMHPLIEETAKKAAVAWLTVPGAGQAYPVWFLWADGALYVVGGAGEQATPGLAELAAGGTVDVTMRGDHGGRVVGCQATVAPFAPTDEAWATIAPQLAGKRLNAAGGAEQTVQRWAAECRVYRITPAAEPAEAGKTLPDGDLVAQPRPSDAARHPSMPKRLHRVRGA